MPSAALKRLAAGEPAAPAKCARKTLDEDGIKCREIVTGLKQVEGMPRDVAMMLGDMLSLALLPYKGERHDLQDRVVALGEEALRSHERKMETQIASSTESIARNEEASDPQKQAAHDAEGVVRQKLEAESGCKGGLAEAAQGFQAAKTALAEAKAACNALDHELEVAACRKEELEKIQKDLVSPLTEGGLDEDVKKSCVTNLVNVLEGLGLEHSIMIAIPASFGKAPEDRGSFDTMVVSQLKEELESRIRKAVSQLEEAEPTKAARTTSVDEAKIALDIATGRQLTSAQEFWDSQAVHQAAQEDLDTMWKRLQGLSKEQKKFRKDLQNMEGRLANFGTGVLATYSSLRDRAKPESMVQAPQQEALAEE